MTAPFDTTKHERVGRGAKASPSVSPSCSAALDANGKVRRHGAFSRGHHVHVVSNQPKKGFSVTPPDVLTPILPVELARALSRVLFQPNSHWSRYPSSLAVTNRGVSCAPALPRVNSHDLTGANRSVVQSTPRKHVSRRLAYVGKHLRRLSSVSDLVGIDPNENGLTHAKASFAPGAKAND